MEIHRRTSAIRIDALSSNGEVAALLQQQPPPRVVVNKSNNGQQQQPPGANRASSRSSSSSSSSSSHTTNNPYNASSSSSAAAISDVVLFRSIQFLIMLFAAWFTWCLLVFGGGNPPPTTTTPPDDAVVAPFVGSPASSRAAAGGGGGVGVGVGGGGGPLRGTATGGIAVAVPGPGDFEAARDEIRRMREEFHARYGGRDAAAEMLGRGLLAFDDAAKEGEEEDGSRGNAAAGDVDDGGGVVGGPIRYTADRLLSAIARHESRPPSSASSGSSSSSSSSPSRRRPEFVMAFAGYSVTVGRGNHLEEAYPHVLGRILSPLLSMPPLGINLVVRNSAIGGIPSFPYGWCLRNFLGEDADSVSWDYGMNEGNGASGLESYVRQSLLSMPKTPPLFILLDVKSRPRLDVLRRYVELGVLPDPIALGGKDAVDKKLLELPESERPPGLQRWDEWGAPKGAPGQSPWHARKMEHELMAWMLAMRMLDSVDVALDVMERDVNWRDRILAQEQRRHGSAEIALPPPVTDVSKTGVKSLLYGSQSKPGEWHMSRLSCRTSFLPNISGDLYSIVESGVTKDDNDMLQSRDDALFNEGWVMDVGKVERDTKLTVQKYGGLGYIDMKTALYGIPNSGTLKLWLPYEGHDKNAKKPNENDSASEYFNAVILCEVNEKRGDDECKMISDLTFRLGGSPVLAGDVSQVEDVASYLKKNICIRVNVPADAKVSSKRGDTDFGLSLEVTVSGTGVSREKGACSISHVIWENQCGHST